MVDFQTYPIQAAGVPSYFASVTSRQQDGELARRAVYMEGQEVHAQLSQATPTAFEVRNLDGDLVASGPVSGTDVNLGSDYEPGWYRCYFTGPFSDPLYGPGACGAFCFHVTTQTPNLPDHPPSTFTIFNYKPNGFGRTDQMVNEGSNRGATTDMITRAVMGMGAGRVEYSNDLTYPIDGPQVNGGRNAYDAALWIDNVGRKWWLDPQPGDPGIPDPVRERRCWLAFDTQAWDWLVLHNTTGPSYEEWATIFARDPSQGSSIYLSLTTGTVSGHKVTVYYPDAATVAETYDNVASSAAFCALAQASSTLIYAITNHSGLTPVIVSTPAAIGSIYYEQLRDVVAQLYPKGFTHFEGPYNEWPDGFSAAYMMRNFHAAVHAGHPDAVAMGPCFVDITNGGRWASFLSNGGADYCDAISFHDYNTCLQGDVTQGRNNIQAFFALLESYGVDVANTEMWQTEATHAKDQDLFAVAKWRYARFPILKTLLWEQYGIPAEKNPYWYDEQRGFWAYSAYFMYFFSINAQAGLQRVLTDETFGKNFHHPVDFGSVAANEIFIGNVYGESSTGSTMVMACSSAIDPTPTVTLNVLGDAEFLEVVNGNGAVTTVAVVGGKITVDVEDIPTYVRLPAGVNANVHEVFEWGENPPPSVSATQLRATLGGSSAQAIGNDLFLEVYQGGTSSAGIVYSTSTLPDSIEILFPANKEVLRVVLWNGPGWQSMPCVWDYDVETLDDDGVTWTKRKTVTRDEPSSVWFGDLYTQRETFFKYQWIEVVELDVPVVTKGVRVYVRGATYGGAPDSDMVEFTSKRLDANSMAVPKLAVQELSVISPTVATPAAPYLETIESRPGLIAYWGVNELTGSIAEEPINGLAGDYTAGKVLGRSPLIRDDGSSFGGQLLVPHNNLLNVGDVFTLELWMLPVGVFVGQFRNLFDKGNFSFSFGTNTDGRSYLARITGTGTTVIATSDAVLSIGTSYHLVCTKNGSTTKLYVNGVEGTVPGTNLVLVNTGSQLRLAGNLGDSYDAFAIYNQELTAEEVLGNYLSGIRPTLPVNSVEPVVFS